MDLSHLPYSKYHLAHLKRSLILNLSFVFFLATTLLLIYLSQLNVPLSTTQAQTPHSTTLPATIQTNQPNLPSLTIRSQGISSDVGPLTGQLIIKTTSTTDYTVNLEFTHLFSGTYQAQLPTLNQLAPYLSSSNSPTVLLRLDRHQLFNLSASQLLTNSSLDFTTTPLIPGDAAGNDGLITRQDLTAVSSSLGTTNPDRANSADVNFDGTVNAIDLNLVRTALDQQPIEIP